MPFPHEHSARMISPDKFEKDGFRSKDIAPGVRIIIGKLKGQETTTVQTYRFDSSKFTAEKAKAWLKRHDIKNISFSTALRKAFLHVSDNLYIDLTKAIEEREDAPKSVPKKYKGVKRKQFADSKNYLYPLDSEKHVRAAISYLGMPRNYQKYDKNERKIIAGKIRIAAKKYKIEISEDWLEKFDLMEKAKTFLLKKAKAVPTGTISKSGEYKKAADGKWVKIKKDKKSKSEKEKSKEKQKLDEKKKGTIKNALKKVANILAELLSGKDVVTPTGSAIEETGESVKIHL